MIIKMSIDSCLVAKWTEKHQTRVASLGGEAQRVSAIKWQLTDPAAGVVAPPTAGELPWVNHPAPSKTVYQRIGVISGKTTAGLERT